MLILPTVVKITGVKNKSYKQIAAKPLQIATWLLLAAYRNLSTPYPTVPSSTPYDVLFSHSAYVTDDRRQTDGRHIISATVSTVG